MPYNSARVMARACMISLRRARGTPDSSCFDWPLTIRHAECVVMAFRHYRIAARQARKVQFMPTNARCRWAARRALAERPRCGRCVAVNTRVQTWRAGCSGKKPAKRCMRRGGLSTCRRTKSKAAWKVAAMATSVVSAAPWSAPDRISIRTAARAFGM